MIALDLSFPDQYRDYQIKVDRALETFPVHNHYVRAESSGEGEFAPVRLAFQRAIEGAPKHVFDRLEAEYFGAGPIETLLQLDGCTEIIINGQDKIWYEQNGKLHRFEDRFLSALTYRNFVTRLSREAGIIANLECPFANGHWRGCRVHLVLAPVASSDAAITLRRHPQSPWNFDALRNSEWATPQAFSHLRDLIDSKKSFLIVGPTGSGKTSVLNACLSSLPACERLVVIEDTSELSLPSDSGIKLLTRKDSQGLLPEIDQTELLKQALRMRPDRIIMGEIRGGEAKDLLMAFATGHAGCMGTLHAESARQALLRLEMLIQLGAPQWSLQAVRTLIWLSVQSIVVVGKAENGERRLQGIYRISSLEDVGFLLEKEI